MKAQELCKLEIKNMGFEISTTLMSLNTNSCTKAHTYTRHTLSLCLPLCHPHTHTHTHALNRLPNSSCIWFFGLLHSVFICRRNQYFSHFVSIAIMRCYLAKFRFAVNSTTFHRCFWCVSLTQYMHLNVHILFIFWLQNHLHLFCIHLLDVMEEDETTSTNRPSGHCIECEWKSVHLRDLTIGFWCQPSNSHALFSNEIFVIR